MKCLLAATTHTLAPQLNNLTLAIPDREPGTLPLQLGERKRHRPMSNKKTAITGLDETYLRELAQRCVGLARECPHLATAHGLEALAAQLMAKAAEVQELRKIVETEGGTGPSARVPGRRR
jgi:hypothetical protein